MDLDRPLGNNTVSAVSSKVVVVDIEVQLLLSPPFEQLMSYCKPKEIPLN